MYLLEPRIRQFLPEWGVLIYTEETFFESCYQANVIFKETDLIDGAGEFRSYRNQPFIFLNTFTEASYRNWVLWHEFAHFMLHDVSCAQFSDAVTRRKIERQANHVAAVCLMPTWLIDRYTMDEIRDNYGYPWKLILLRKHFAELYRF